MDVNIIYRSDLAKKGKDFLRNPKGFSVINSFSTKTITGKNIKSDLEKNEFVRQYQLLNPKFPIVNIKIANKEKTLANVKPSIQNIKPVITKEQKKIIQDIIETKKPIITKPIENKKDESFLSSPIFLGLILVSGIYFLSTSE